MHKWQAYIYGLIFGGLVLSPMHGVWSQDILESECEARHDVLGKVNILRSWNAKSHTCIVYVSDPEYSSSIRKFNFSSEGKFQIFSDFGKGGGGARSYFIFPRKQAPDYLLNVAGKSVAVTLAGGQLLHFESETGKLGSMTGAQFREDPRITKNNQGGFELSLSEGLLLDAGFGIGGDAYGRSERKSTLKDTKGRSCELKNSDLFVYTYAIDEKSGKKTFLGAEPKFKNDAEFLSLVLANPSCAKLDLSSIRPNTGPAVSEVCAECEKPVRSAAEILDEGPRSDIKNVERVTGAEEIQDAGVPNEPMVLPDPVLSPVPSPESP